MVANHLGADILLRRPGFATAWKTRASINLVLSRFFVLKIMGEPEVGHLVSAEAAITVLRFYVVCKFCFFS